MCDIDRLKAPGGRAHKQSSNWRISSFKSASEFILIQIEHTTYKMSESSGDCSLGCYQHVVQLKDIQFTITYDKEKQYILTTEKLGPESIWQICL